LVSTAREVYAKGGVPAFWAGLGPSCLLVVSFF
jgi:solute carrier family 25 (peroxisomal adenine nucleotide transporter), member 17